MIELAINEETTINNIRVKCIIDSINSLCNKCIYGLADGDECTNYACCANERKDNQYVHFEKVD